MCSKRLDIRARLQGGLKEQAATLEVAMLPGAPAMSHDLSGAIYHGIHYDFVVI